MKRKYTKELLEEVAAVSTSVSEMMRRMGFKTYSGASSSLIRSKLRVFGIDTSHFVGHRTGVGRPPSHKKPPELILVKRKARREDTHRLRRALLESGVPHICSRCGLPPMWEGASLTLQIDHVNGDSLDCRRENLRFVCPNCHTQLATWGYKSDQVR